jgi:uncharacterized protein (TIGR01777 family)
MIVGLTGATGFVGSHFKTAATASGHRVVAYSRQTPPQSTQTGDFRHLSTESMTDFSGLDALVHLAGEPVIGLWTARKRHRIRESRVTLTRGVVAALAQLESRPSVFVCASAIGYYGNRGDEVLTEASEQGGGFLRDVTRGWESAASGAEALGIRVVCLRFGIILGPDGGMLPVLRKLFRCGLGGRLGTGRQWISWIHIDDAVGLILHAIANESLHGAVNATAPAPAINSEFTSQLARSFHRPALFPVPTGFLRLLPGGQAHMFLDSQRVHPKKALQSGYIFQHPSLESAIADSFAPLRR